MIVYLDNDELLKLVAWDLLDETLKVLGATRDDVRILGSAKFRLRKCRSDPKYGGSTTFVRLELLYADLACIQDEPDGYADLVAVNGIDQGEGMLIGHATSTECAYLTTGDKRCLKALTAPELSAYRSKLAGKVVCVEAAIEALIHSVGFERVRDQVLTVPGCDMSIAVAFGSRMATSKESALEALEHYIDELPSDLLFRKKGEPTQNSSGDDVRR